jgi:predicted dehydrogenase
MWNLAPHDISIMSYLLGSEPKSVSARGFYYLRKNIADVAFITIEYKNGVSAHIHVSWLDPNKVRRVTIVGSKKMVVYDDVSEDSKIMIYDRGIDKEHINADLGKYDNYETFLFKHRSGDILIPRINFEEPLRAEVKSFVDCVKNRKRPVTDGSSGLEVVKVLEAASKSLKSGGKVIEL